MKEFILSAKEFLFLCGQMGAKQVFGVENGVITERMEADYEA